jgi:ADP-heptose:LPS heptosyltransferase
MDQAHPAIPGQLRQSARVKPHNNRVFRIKRHGRQLSAGSGKLVGHKDEQEAAAIITKLEPRAKSAVMRTDLFQVTALAQRANFAVGNDTGPMHIAAASGTPCVVLFGPDSDPSRVCPRGRAGVVAIQGESLANLDVGQVDQMIANLGGYQDRR